MKYATVFSHYSKNAIKKLLKNVVELNPEDMQDSVTVWLIFVPDDLEIPTIIYYQKKEEEYDQESIYKRCYLASPVFRRVLVWQKPIVCTPVFDWTL